MRNFLVLSLSVLALACGGPLTEDQSISADIAISVDASVATVDAGSTNDAGVNYDAGSDACPPGGDPTPCTQQGVTCCNDGALRYCALSSDGQLLWSTIHVCSDFGQICTAGGCENAPADGG